jgi:rod shape-determining protein MreC
MVEAVFSRRSPLTVFIVTLLLLLAAMSYQVTDQETGRTVLGSVLFRMFSPAQRILAGSFYVVVGGIQRYFGLVNTNRENERLKQQVEELKIRLHTASRESQENARLRKVLDLQQKIAYKMVVGEIIGLDAKSAVSDKITINRGRTNGVLMQMPVTTPEGIVGMTILVTPHTSQVQLITDPSSAVAAMLQYNGVSGILVGIGGGLCVLKFLPLTTDIKAGDVIVTSGQDGIFPEGLPVGKITRQLSESQYYKSAEVMPYQNFRAIREVVILTHTAQPAPAPQQ